MEARGPEALLLAARLAEHRAIRMYGALEMSQESSMYVEVCVRAPLQSAPRPRGSAAPAGVWARLRAAMVRTEARDADPAGGGRAQGERADLEGLVRSISAAGIGCTGPIPMPGFNLPSLSLGLQPLVPADADGTGTA